MNLIDLIRNFILRLLGIKPTPKKPKIVDPDRKETTITPEPTPNPEPKPKPEPKPLAPVMPITESVMTHKLRLGHLDKGVTKEYVSGLLKQYHSKINAPASDKHHKMRHGDSLDWVELASIDSEAQPVKALQTFLLNAGIFPEWSVLDGFFGYGTLSGVRLFQEYNRIYEGEESLLPTGVVDQRTWEIMKKWQASKKKADNWTRNKDAEEFKGALALMEEAKKHYLANPNFVLEIVDKQVDKLNTGKSPAEQIDTLKVTDWTYSPDDIHLVGIRRRENTSGDNRVNDDLFVLLINGLVFIFWGSTDPNRQMGKRDDEPFLAEGQHKFAFGWHMHSTRTKAYQGLNPFNKGVLVFRDKVDTKRNKLTDEDLAAGIDPDPNKTINIHWTGDKDWGTQSWSAGCQVLAGKSYFDNFNKEREFPDAFVAAITKDFKDEKNTVDHIVKSKAAYNLFTDLVLLYSPSPDKNYLFYTLGRDDVFDTTFLQDLRLRLDQTIASFGLSPDSDDDIEA